MRDKQAYPLLGPGHAHVASIVLIRVRSVVSFLVHGHAADIHGL